MAFIRYGGLVYQLVGYALQSDWRSHASEVASAISSFAPLTDPAELAVQPWTIEIVTLPSAMSLRSYHEQFPGPVDLEVLARLNRRDSGEVLSAGTRIKRIDGDPPP